MKNSRYIIYILFIMGLNLFLAGNAFCEELNKGKMIYQQKCTACHLIKSEGAPVSAYHMQYNPLDFTTYSALKNLTEEKLHFALTRGEGVMRPFKLSSEDYKAIVNYMINDLKKSEAQSMK